MRILARALLSVVFMIGAVAVVWSSEADELRAKAKRMQQEAEQLAKNGHGEEAEKLGREIKELLQAAERHDQKQSNRSTNEINELRQRLKGLTEKAQALKESNNEEGLAKLREHKAAIERELAELEGRQEKKIAPKHGKQPTKLPEGLEDAARRIKHIHIAVENLRAAGMHDVAEEAARRAEAMERELHQARERAVNEQSSGKKGSNKQADPLDELRHELQRVRAELNELREEIKKR